MKSTNFVQHVGNSTATTPADRRSQQGNPAIVRPVVTASGAEIFARVDAKHRQGESQPHSPHPRSVELEDYVAQIKQQYAAAQPASQVPPAPNEEMQSAEVQAILDRIDRAHEEIARQNFQAATTPSTVAAQVPASSRSARPQREAQAKQIVAPPIPVSKPAAPASKVETNVEVPSQESVSASTEKVAKLTSLEKGELLATISSAIASVLSEIPTDRLEEKLNVEIKNRPDDVGSVVDRPSVASPIADINDLKLQPEEPRAPIPAPHLSFPVSQPLAEPIADPVTEPAVETTTSPKEDSSKEISSSVAAWDVDSFRWPTVTDQILTHGSAAIDELSNYCFDILAPFGGTIAVTSPSRGQGATTLALSLCRWSAAKGKRVLLVDADLNNPTLSREVGLAPNLSWIDAVRNAYPACEAIIRSQRTQTCIMPQAPIVSRVVLPPNLYDSLAFLISEIKSEFDLIVLDMGPTQQIVHELTRANDLIDAVLLVDKDLQSTEFLRAKESLIELGILKFVAAQNAVNRAAA